MTGPTASPLGAARSRRTRTIALLAGCLTITLGTASAVAAPGDLDPEFGSGGAVTFPVAEGYSSVALAPDGKIVGAGAAGDGTTAVWRLNPDGSPDTSFGKGGVTKVRLGDINTVPTGIAVRPDGKVVVVGWSGSGVSTTGGFVMRLEAHGGKGASVNDGLDLTFDLDGMLVLPGGLPKVVALQPDAKIVAAGHNITGSTSMAVVWRIRADGAAASSPNDALDRTFGADGRSEISNQGWEHAQALALQPDGKIVLTGYSRSASYDTDAAVWRVKADGGTTNEVNSGLDTSFDVDGVAGMNLGYSDVAYTVAVLPGGKIIAGGNTSGGADGTDAVVWRLQPNGGTANTPNNALDETFDVDGYAQMHPAGSDSINALSVQPDGKIVAAGGARPRSGTRAVAVWRLEADGGTANVPDDALDRAFGTDGLTRIASNGAEASALALQPDGRILVAALITDSAGTMLPTTYRLLGADPAPTETPPPTTSETPPPTTSDTAPPTDSTTSGDTGSTTTDRTDSEPLAPRIRLALASAHSARARVRVRVTNLGASTVLGRLSAGRAARTKTFRVAPSAAVVVTLRLTRTARRTLARTGRLRLRLRASVSDGTRTATATKRVRVRVAPRRRGA